MPRLKRTSFKKVVNKKLSDFNQWRVDGQQAVKIKRYWKEVICPTCFITRCFRLNKMDFLWSDKKIYDRYYYPQLYMKLKLKSQKSKLRAKVGIKVEIKPKLHNLILIN